MEQLNFLDQLGSGRDITTDLFDYRPGLIGPAESKILLNKLIKETDWTQKAVLMYGKEVITPRLTAWFGDGDADYSIKGKREVPSPWTEDLLAIKSKVEKLAGMSFNSVLLNYYRDGNDSVSWHSDGDGIPGRNMFVASVSLGQERVFDIRNKENHTIKFNILLEDGSYLLMKGDFQDKWQHRIAKSTIPMKERVNLTFRISRT